MVEETVQSKTTSTDGLDSPSALVGRQLDGKYRLNEVIYMGGMGIVYEATQLSIDRQIAAKILRPTLADDPEYLKRFQREIALLSQFYHPNIVTIIDADRDSGGLHYLIMEYIDGVTLGKLFDEERLDLLTFVQALQQVCDALWEAHRADIIHRDLKLENIMVQRRNQGQIQAKLLDFGVARDFTDRSNLTKKGDVPGTPGIVAPELLDQANPSPKSDLYSIGIMIYTVLTGEPPFDEENDLELIRAHQNEEIPPIEKNAVGFTPPDLIELTYDLVEKRPEKRPPDPLAVKAELKSIESKLKPSSSSSHSSESNAPGTRQSEDSYPNRGPVIRAIFGQKPFVAPQNILMILTSFLGGLAFVLLLLIFQAAIGY